MEDNTAVAAAILEALGFCQEEIEEILGGEKEELKCTLN